MTNLTTTLMVNCEVDAASEIQANVNLFPDSRSQISQRKNLDGGPADAIVIATMAIQTIPQMLNFIVQMIQVKRVSKIKLGDLEIENPSPEDVRLLRDHFLKQYDLKG